MIIFFFFFSSEEATCLFNKPSFDAALPRILPGKLLTLDQQCERISGTKACHVSSSSVLHYLISDTQYIPYSLPIKIYTFNQILTFHPPQIIWVFFDPSDNVLYGNLVFLNVLFDNKTNATTLTTLNLEEKSMEKIQELLQIFLSPNT